MGWVYLDEEKEERGGEEREEEEYYAEEEDDSSGYSLRNYEKEGHYITSVMSIENRILMKKIIIGAVVGAANVLVDHAFEKYDNSRKRPVLRKE
jgi:hypothetical protein